MNKIYIFGAGNVTKTKIERIPSNFYYNILKKEIQGILDNDIRKQNTYLSGIRIFSPHILLSTIWDYVIISSGYYEEISKQLVETLEIPLERIKLIDEYLQDRFIEYQYENNQILNQEINQLYLQKFNCNSMVVYTAIRDGYDDLKEPLVINEKFKYICFTNNKMIKSDIWEIRNPEDYMDITEDNLWDKKLKVLPHRFLPEYETSIWLDASMQIVGELCQYMDRYQKYSDLLFIPHYERECIYEEAAACIILGKGNKQNIIRQINYYFEEKYPFDNGLVCGGFMIRNHNIGYVKKVMEDWWKQICIFSTRDQISLPYVLWKNQCVVDVSKEYCNDNDWIKVYAHK